MKHMHKDNRNYYINSLVSEHKIKAKIMLFSFKSIKNIHGNNMICTLVQIYVNYYDIYN